MYQTPDCLPVWSYNILNTWRSFTDYYSEIIDSKSISSVYHCVRPNEVSFNKQKWWEREGGSKRGVL